MMSEKRLEIKICGRAGQGVLLLGEILGYAALLQGKFVSVSPSIGPEPRGGVSSCDVILSNTPIDFPRVIEADIMLALSNAAYERYISSLGKEGAVFYDPLFLRFERPPRCEAGKPRHYGIPAAEAAQKELKGLFGANIAFLGCALRLAKAVSLDALTKSLRAILPAQTLQQNLKALDVGMRLAKKVKFP